MAILSDLFRTGLGMAANYGMNQIPTFQPPLQSPPGTMQGISGSDRPALGSSGINMADPLTKLAMQNLNMQPFQGGGILSGLANTGLQTGMQMGLTKLIPMIASLFP